MVCQKATQVSGFQIFDIKTIKLARAGLFNRSAKQTSGVARIEGAGRTDTVPGKTPRKVMKKSHPHLIGLCVCIVGMLSPAAVRADGTTDARIEDATKNSYVFRTHLKDDSIKVDAEEGVVTLKGSAADDSHKMLAEETAANLPGVVRVDNQIEVKPPAKETSDDWIAIKVWSRIFLQADVSAADTAIAVKDGVVTLSGTADSKAQKELTELCVKEVEGVKGVENKLVVATPPAEPKRSLKEVIDDASITAQVKYTLLANRATSALRTNITTKNGVVVVGGEARNEAEKTLVTKLARNVRGVQEVRNEMKVAG